MKKTFLFLLFLWSAMGFAQLNNFYLYANPQYGNCGNPGGVTWGFYAITAGSTMTFTITDTDTNIVVASSLSPTSQTDYYGEGAYNNLPTGNYTLTATQTLNGQTGTKAVDFYIGQRTYNQNADVTATPVTCKNNGEATVIIRDENSGDYPNPPYTYYLYDSANNLIATHDNDNPTFTGLIDSNYSVKITDACGTAISKNFTVANNELNADISIEAFTTATATGCTASVKVNPVRGIGPYAITASYTDAITGQAVSQTKTVPTIQDVVFDVQNISSSYPVQITVNDACGTTPPISTVYNFPINIPFAVRAMKVSDENCPAGGTISWETGCTVPDAVMTYSIIDTENGNIVATTSANSFNGLTAGSYRISATQTYGSQSQTAVSNIVVIQDKIVPLYWGARPTPSTCANNGLLEVSVYIYDPHTDSNIAFPNGPYKYEVLDSNLNAIITQTSNIFDNLAPGTYKIRVTDGCGKATVQDYNIEDHTLKADTPVSLFGHQYYQNGNCMSLVHLSLNGGQGQAPYTYTINYTDPITGQTVTNSISSFGEAIFQVPYFNVEVEITGTVRDSCPDSPTLTAQGIIEVGKPQVNATTENANSCNPISYYKLWLSNGVPITLTGISGPAGFVAAGSYPDNYTDTTIYNYATGVPSKSLPAGLYTYTYKTVCGYTGTSTFYVTPVEPNSTSAFISPFPYSNKVWLNCDGKTINKVLYVTNKINGSYSNNQINTLMVIEAPQEYIDSHGSLPYTIPADKFFSNKNNVMLDGLFPGHYKLAYESCLNGTTEFDVVLPVEKVPNLVITPTCNGSVVNADNFETGYYADGYYFIQKYNEATNTWGWDGQTDNSPQVNFQSPGMRLLNGNIVNQAGRYRMYYYPMRFYAEKYEAADTFLERFCVDVPYTFLKEFTVEGELQLNNAYAFQCADGTYDVALAVTSNSPTLHYAIVSDETASASIINDNGTNPIFHSVSTGQYYFRVIDECGNYITRKLDLAYLGKPSVRVIPDCTTTPGSLRLSVDGLSYLKFEWRKTKDASGSAIANPPILATTPTLDLGTYDASDAGTYTVHMYTDPSSGYCIDNSQDMQLTVDALTAAHAGQGQVANINYDGVSPTLDLFTLLKPDASGNNYDGFGTWAETTVPSSALLTGHNWNIAAAAPGTYSFTYTVAAPCGGATQTATVVINLAKLCYRLPATSAAGQEKPTLFGITAMGRAGNLNADNWPMVRKGGWMALEANSKGFVVNRVAFDANNLPVGIPAGNFVAGMMVFDTTNKCLKIYNGTVWSCYTTQTCPN